jgi:Xaa-Pro dipeptidase
VSPDLLVSPGLVDAAIKDFLRAERYACEDCRLHRTGHGVGLGKSVEPGIYLKGQGEFPHSDRVLVTRDGHECLARCRSDSESLTIRAWRLMTRFKGIVVRRALELNKKAALG